MLRATFCSLVIICLLSCAAKRKLSKQLESSNIYDDVKVLSDDDMKGREVGTSGEKKAARYIATRFKGLGLKPLGATEEPGSNSASELHAYFQDFVVFEHVNPHDTGDSTKDRIPVSARNVVAFIDNNAPYTVVIGGHYDHLGFGSFASLYNGAPEIHNGADDNASGIAAMLHLAEVLQGNKHSFSNYLFIAFSGQERGLWGSDYWTKNPTYPIEKLSYMINFDRVGRMEDKKFAINGTGTSPNWSSIDKVTKGYDVVKSESGIGPSDHSSFYLVEVPAVHFFTGQHEDYHKPTDDVEKVNVEGILRISNMIVKLVQELQGAKLTFTKTKEE